MTYLADLIIPSLSPIKPPNEIPSGLDMSLLAGNALTIVFVVAILLTLYYLLRGGIQWIMSQGDKQKVASARNRIVYAIFGLVLIFLAFFIVSVVGGLFNVPLIGN